MPGYIIHLAEAKMIFNILKEKDKTREGEYIGEIVMKLFR